MGQAHGSQDKYNPDFNNDSILEFDSAEPIHWNEDDSIFYCFN
jgi:hypothetical protein